MITGLVLNNGNPITLIPNSTTTVHVNFTVTDDNGCADVFGSGGHVTTTVYAGDDGACVTSAFACYRVSTTTHNCTGNNPSANATATVDLYYFALATDASSSAPSLNWRAGISAQDASGSIATASSTGVELNSLLALAAGTSSIDYGEIPAGQNSGSNNQIVPLRNAGNTSSTLLVSGTALDSGSDSIATSSQRYATGTFAFGGGERQLSDAAVAISGFLMQSLGYAVWQTDTPLSAALYLGRAVLNDGYIFHTGGGEPSAAVTSSVSSAPIQSAGTLGGWFATTPLPYKTHAHASVVHNDRLYVLGGADEDEATSTVYHAPILSGGSLGPWATTTPLPHAFYLHSAVVLNDHLYSIGGIHWNITTTTVTSSVFYAPINSNGTIGSWTRTASLPVPINLHSAAAAGGRIYVPGGASATTSYTSTYYAGLSGGGPDLTAWATTTALLLDHHRNSTVTDGRFLYVLGGYTLGVFPTNLTQVAPIAADGRLGPWSFWYGTPRTQYYHSAVLENGFIYSLGGVVSSTVSSTAYRIPVPSKNTYWGLEIPGGSDPGTYAGTVTFTAVFSP